MAELRFDGRAVVVAGRVAESWTRPMRVTDTVSVEQNEETHL
jgi:hypothetical protein